MKRKLSIVAALAALLMMVVPASSLAASATFFPLNTKFEIAGPKMPVIKGSLPGECTLGKITGTTPATNSNVMKVPPPTVSCTGGMTVTVAPEEWVMLASQYYEVIFSPNLLFRYSSLPGCKLIGGSPRAAWSNGTTNALSPSVFHGTGTFTATWSNDAASCALAGKSEQLTFGTGSVSGGALVQSFGTQPIAVNELP